MSFTSKLENGKYKLSDGRILEKKDDVFTVLGHRSKSKMRALLSMSLEKLLGLFKVTFRTEAPENITKEELINRILPRPKVKFSALFVDSSESKDALLLKSLLSSATKIR